MKKIYFLFILGVFNKSFSQDVHLTQYFISPQVINPAAFGVENKFEAGAQYRSQWNAFNRGFTTYSAFVNKQITLKKKKKENESGFFAVGLNASHDQSGDGKLTNVAIGLPINYSIKLDEENFLTSGVNLGFNQKSISGTNLTWGSQYDGMNYNPTLTGENKIQQSKTALDVGAGISWVNKKDGKTFTHRTEPFNIIGFSVSHINRPSYSFYNSDERMMIRYNLYQYCNIFLSPHVYVSPSIMLQRQGTANEIIFGSMLRYKVHVDSYITGVRGSNSIGFGLYYRVLDAIVVNSMYDYKNCVFGASYDLNVSKLYQSSKSRGGMEIYFKIKNPFDYLFKGYRKKSLELINK